jgi:hypothetical protein
MGSLMATVRIGGWAGRVRPGDVIGRLHTSVVPLQDPRVSEAHALVSFRAGELWLLALRGRLRVRQSDGESRVQAEVRLRPGLRIEFTPDSILHVEAVELPTVLVGIAAPGIAPHVPLGVQSVVEGPDGLALMPGPDRHALATVWADGDVIIVHRVDAPLVELGVDEALEIGGHRLRAVRLHRAGGEVPATERGGIHEALTIVARYDNVELRRTSAPAEVLGGQLARAISEVIALGGVTRWDLVASTLWPGEPPHAPLRSRWDALMTRLRRTLRARGLRDDLLVQSGTGEVALKRYPDDVIVDEQ